MLSSTLVSLTARRALSILLILTQIGLPVARAETGPNVPPRSATTPPLSGPKPAPLSGPMPRPKPKLPKYDWDRIDRVKNRKISRYSGEILEADLVYLNGAGFEQGLYIDRNHYQAWWERRRKLLLHPEYLKIQSEKTVSEFSSAIYLLFLGERAQALDAADPDTESKKSLKIPTVGEIYLARATKKMDEKPFWSNVLGIAKDSGWAVLVFVGGAIAGSLMFGPVTQIVSSVLQPFMRPSLERIDRFTWTNIAPKFVWWQKLLAGQAVDAEHPSLPGVTTEENLRHQNATRTAAIHAENIHVGTMVPQLRNARNTAMELLYRSNASIAARLQIYKTYLMTTEIYFETVMRKRLGEKISDEDLAKFKSLIDRQQDILVYQGDTPALYERDAEMRELIAKWQAAGVSDQHLTDLYQYQVNRYVGENGPALILTEYLDAEMLFPDANIGLGKNAETKMILARQEIGRQMHGLYGDMVYYQEKIEKLFAAFGVEYSVTDRIANGQAYSTRAGLAARTIFDCRRILMPADGPGK